MENKNLAAMIDHTLLKPDAKKEEIETLCHEAMEYHFCSVCVNPSYVEMCANRLKDSGVKVCTVIGFPLGANTTKTKVYEAVEALENGAHEIDMVIHIGAVKNHDWEYVKQDMKAVVDVVSGKGILKVIMETCLLTDEEKIEVCKISKAVGADFVKTSTGFSSGGATVEDIALMRTWVGENMGVKASGGIRSKAAALEMIGAGANRLGTSSGKIIVE
ncbi:MAG TPA: deoxyribose-phosphate aldolase [Candidatus Merdenecus merdavium]|nr:deoxyribose-phosphate aldolase [Candidatus Merdenecus merdavium]